MKRLWAFLAAVFLFIVGAVIIVLIRGFAAEKGMIIGAIPNFAIALIPWVLAIGGFRMIRGKTSDDLGK